MNNEPKYPAALWDQPNSLGLFLVAGDEPARVCSPVVQEPRVVPRSSYRAPASWAHAVRPDIRRPPPAHSIVDSAAGKPEPDKKLSWVAAVMRKEAKPYAVVAAAQPVALDLAADYKDADVLSSSSTMKGEECDSASSTSELSDCAGPGTCLFFSHPCARTFLRDG